MKVIILCLLAMGLWACGGDSKSVKQALPGIPGEGLPALTDDQKSRSEDVSAEVNGLDKSSLSFNKNKEGLESGGSSQGQLTQFALDKLPQEEASVGTVSPKSLELKNFETSIEGALGSGACALDVGEMEPIFSGEEEAPAMIPGRQKGASVAIDFKIVDGLGGKCPIAMSMLAKMSTDSTMAQGELQEIKFNLNFSSNFSFLNPEVGKAFNVEKYKNSMNMEVKIQGQESQGGVMNMTVSGEGEIQSKEEGLIKIKTTGQGQGTFGETSENSLVTIATELKYADFTVVGAIRTLKSGSGEAIKSEVQYFINGTAVSKEEYLKIIPMEQASDNMSVI